ncbi:hypothetical protein HY415_00635 [Candidatus Kaiserbacteria bacterium]|nr:hypothetical protein [Candidatus Kaiserbacteria bacterium]
MAGTRHPKETRAKVLKMGLSGKTYTQIRAIYPVPKSTLSFWFKRANSPRALDRTHQLIHLEDIRKKARKTIMERRQAWIAKARQTGAKEADRFSLSNVPFLKALLAMLYWAEGAKHEKVHGLVFVNTDPKLMSLYISLLRKTYPLDESRFRVRLHLHYYHRHAEAIVFWSNLLHIPPSQFGKIYVKKRSKSKRFRKNFQGICFVKYPANPAREELLALGRTLSERMKM